MLVIKILYSGNIFFFSLEVCFLKVAFNLAVKIMTGFSEISSLNFYILYTTVYKIYWLKWSQSLFWALTCKTIYWGEKHLYKITTGIKVTVPVQEWHKWKSADKQLTYFQLRTRACYFVIRCFPSPKVVTYNQVIVLLLKYTYRSNVNEETV